MSSHLTKTQQEKGGWWFGNKINISIANCCDANDLHNQPRVLCPRPYCSPAFLSIISRRGPSKRVNAGASSAATFSFGELVLVRWIALTVAARGASLNSDNSVCW